MTIDADVVIIGSGFGGSVAALRFAEAGYSVIVLERGGWVTREHFEADADMFWDPSDGHYGINQFQKRGKTIIPWLGAGVGGGSHVYAATLKRRDFFDDFPQGIDLQEMAPYYERAEKMMGGNKYPDYPPYNKLPAYVLFRKAERRMAKAFPELVEEQGDILLGISFAPEGEQPGSSFTNDWGANQRYSDPEEQKILGGDIDSKNTLDKNYLFRAQELGAKISPFSQAEKILQTEDGNYVIEWCDPRQDQERKGKLTASILVVSAGTIGSTELLFKCRHAYKTLPKISPSIGKFYSSNGDYVTLLIPKRGLLLSWGGLVGAIVGLVNGWLPFMLFSVLLYIAGWVRAGKKPEPDIGTTNSDYIRFSHRDGSTQGAYIEGGRYPTPFKAGIAIVMSLFGQYDPKKYRTISKYTGWFSTYVPVFELIARSWPVPLLMMGRDDAVGQFYLDEDEKIAIDFPLVDNRAYIKYLEKIGRLFSKEAKSYFIPNFITKLFKIIEVPHNLGGVPMGAGPEEGVVDHCGRMFGYDNLLVLDGSIIPVVLGPNPALTILALSERAMERILKQLEEISVTRAIETNVH